MPMDKALQREVVYDEQKNEVGYSGTCVSS